MIYIYIYNGCFSRLCALLLWCELYDMRDIPPALKGFRGRVGVLSSRFFFIYYTLTIVLRTHSLTRVTHYYYYY